MSESLKVIPTGWKRVYAILSMADGGCYETDAFLERCLLPKGHIEPCEFPAAVPVDKSNG